MIVGNGLRFARLVAALSLLAACAVTTPRPPAPAAVPPTAPAAPTPVIPAPIVQADTPPASAAKSPWRRMRDRFAMPGCDYSAQVMQWAQRFAAHPERFAETWRPAMPFLLLALDEIERRNLPGEFALLPYVESHYQPLAGKGQRPAGAWQLMPRTARDQGLRLSKHYDGRLDVIDSTRVALDLLERYDREFGDWRLATMAFNAGEYRVKRELRERPAATLDATQLASLKLSPITHEHLAKLLALACIIADPQRFRVTLPEPQAHDVLAEHMIEGSIDLRLAARYADMSFADLHRLNAAHLGERSAPLGPHRLLLPRQKIAQFVAMELADPMALRGDWRTVKIPRTTSLSRIARDAATPATTLALANGLDPEATLAAGTSLLVPGRPAVARVLAPPTANDTHVIRSGDTLSAIAHRYGVRIIELLNWNALRANSVLRLGARLRISAP